MALLYSKERLLKKPRKILRPNLAHPQLQGCVMWYPILDHLHHNIRDVVGNTTGKITGTSSGIQGDNLYLNGGDSTSADCITLPNTIYGFGGSSEWALSFYIYTQRLRTNDTPGIGSGASSYPLMRMTTGGAAWQFLAHNGSSYFISGSSSGSVLLNEWEHIIWGYDGADCLVYRDGVLTDTLTATDGQIIVVNGASHRIGGGLNAGLGGWQGLLRDFRLYNVAPSAQLARSIYENPLAPLGREIWIPVTAVEPTIYERTVSDSLSLTDQQNRLGNLYSLVIDSLNLQDKQWRNIYVGRVIQDSLDLNDEQWRNIYVGRVVQDSLDLNDEQWRNIYMGRVPQDSLDLNDEQWRNIYAGRVVQDSVDLEDLIIRQIISWVVNERTVTDSVSLTDSQIRYLILSRFLIDNFELVDNQTRYLILSRFLIDDIDLADALVREITLPGTILYTRILQDSVIANDVMLRSVELYRKLNEEFDLTDTLTRTLRIPFVVRTLTDTLDLTDSVQRDIFVTTLGKILVALIRPNIVTDIKATSIKTGLKNV